MPSGDLAGMLDRGELAECVAFFAGMSEMRRRELAQECKKLRAAARKSSFQEVQPGTFVRNPSVPAAEAAFLATATLAEIKQGGRAWPVDDDVVLAILTDRRPDWVDGWVEWLLSDAHYWGHWRLVRRLIAAGLCRKPDLPQYYLGMISGLGDRSRKQPLVESLLESPDLLEHDLWKLFEYEGGGENSLANVDRWGQSWSASLATLASQGQLSRERLLDEALGALERDFNHYRARWFLEFYDRLDPTEAELAAHGPRLLGLLRASAPNVVSWAWSKVTELAGRRAYEAGELIGAMEPLLRQRAKGIVQQALAVLESLAVADPASSGAVSQVVTQALAHERPDVQRTALAVLEKVGSVADVELRVAVGRYADSVAPSLRKRLARWLTEVVPEALPKMPASGDGELPGDELPAGLRERFAIDGMVDHWRAGRLQLPAARFDGTDLSRLAVVERLVPIGELDELVAVAARVIEDGTLVDDAERCLDALSRLCGERPTDWERRLGPLRKRAEQLLRKGAVPFCGFDPGHDLVGLILAFATGEVIRPVLGRTTIVTHGTAREWDGLHFTFDGEVYPAIAVNMRKAIGFLSRRCQALAERIAGRNSGELLSAPTHTGGWIEPAELVRRVESGSGDEPEPYDVCLALLRLAPDGRGEARRRFRPQPVEWMRAVAYALGAELEGPTTDSPLWVAAARARQPWADDRQLDARFPGLGPDATVAASCRFRYKTRKSANYTFVDMTVESEPPAPKSQDERLVTVTLHTQRTSDRHYQWEMGGFGGRTVGSVRWTATIWPGARDSYFAGSAMECFQNLDWSEARWQNRALLEPLLDPGTPLRDTGLWFLVGMLAAKEPGEAGLATDIAIRAIQDGRLGSDNLGAGLRELLPTGVMKPGRWQKTLSDVARISPVHAATVFVAVQGALREAPADLPKDVAKLLELLVELAAELSQPIADGECRQWLAQLGTKGKSGRLAHELLARTGEPEAAAIGATRVVLRSALELRCQAARRFHPDPAQRPVGSLPAVG
ncbi:MAG: DUF6493 family protein [Pirellulaceae bacterium]